MSWQIFFSYDNTFAEQSWKRIDNRKGTWDEKKKVSKLDEKPNWWTAQADSIIKLCKEINIIIFFSFSCLYCPGYRWRCRHIWDCALLLQWRARPVSKYTLTHTYSNSPHKHTKTYIFHLLGHLRMIGLFLPRSLSKDSWATMMSGTILYAWSLQATNLHRITHREKRTFKQSIRLLFLFSV